MSRFRFGDMESLLRVAAQAAVQGVVARTRQEVKRVLDAARREREAGVQEVARLRAELAQEVEQPTAAVWCSISGHVSGHAAQPSWHNAGRHVLW